MSVDGITTPPNTHTHTCKHWQSRTMIFDSLKTSTCVFDVLPATVGHFVCKIADTQLVYDVSALNRGSNPIFFNIPLYARVGNLQPFARIHKSWTVLVCNVVLGLNVECRSMSSVDSVYKLTHTQRFIATWSTTHVVYHSMPKTPISPTLN